ncbi:MAG: GtrA family protein [Spirochaetia bacterium]|jgi:putative flippase GtrA
MKELMLRILNIRFARFLLIGFVNTVFGYTAFFFVSLTGLHYLIILLISTCLGILFNFFTVSRIVFKNKENKLLLRFFIVYGITYLLNAALIKILKISISNILVIQAILTLPLAVFSYVLNRSFVFKKIRTTDSILIKGKNGQSC